MTPERLAEIKARCDAATPGPWFPGPKGSVRAKGCGGKTVMKQGAAKQRYSDEADIQFITHARADVKELEAEVERLRAELAHYHCDSCDGSAVSCHNDKRRHNA